MLSESHEKKDTIISNSSNLDASDSSISRRLSLSSISINSESDYSKDLNKSNTSLDTFEENENWRGLEKDTHNFNSIDNKSKRSRPTK